MIIEYKAEDIIKNIENRLPHDIDYSEFYIGVTNDFTRKLSEHNVDFYLKTTICYSAIDKENALSAQDYFLDKGMKGNKKEGTYDYLYVYCYKITGLTIQ